MNSPEYQKQHRISKVYLKEFGYKKGDEWYISVWEKSKNYTDNIRIDEFTAETNIFDLPFEDLSIKRHFENTSQKIEDRYKTILNTIRNQNPLNPKHLDLLCHYIANLICRSKPSREYFQFLLENDMARNYFLEEITMFEPEILLELKDSFPLIPSEHRLNLAIGYIMNYLVRVLRNFTFVILESMPEKGWFTSDNPILIDSQESYNLDPSEYLHVIPIESEIYFPLSIEYCLFGFHQKSKKQDNPLRQLSVNKINKINDETHDRICKRIGENGFEYFIFNQEIEKTFLDKE